MKPQIIQLRDALEESTADINQTACAIELILNSIFEADRGNGEGSVDTIAATYPIWREVLFMAWKNLLRTRDKMADSCMRVGDGDTQQRMLSTKL